VKELDAGGRLDYYSTAFTLGIFNDYPLYFSNLPGGKCVADYDETFLNRIKIPGLERSGTVKFLDAYWETVQDFFTVSGFADYLNANSAAYASYVNEIYDSLPDFDAVSLLEDYYGNRDYAELVLVPSDLSLPLRSNYAATIKYPEGKTSVFAFLCLGLDKNSGTYTFRNKEKIERMIFREFGRAFSVPVINAHGADFQKYEFLMDAFSGQLETRAYDGWDTVMEELLNRAVQARLIRKVKGEAAARQFLKMQKEVRHFVFIEDFYNRLEEYENNRAKYKTLGEFYPVLAASLANWGAVPAEKPSPLGLWWFKEVKGGVKITGVARARSGYRSGIRQGDIITAINGEPVTGAEAYRKFNRSFNQLNFGEFMTFSVLRNGGKEDIRVTRGMETVRQLVPLGTDYKNVPSRRLKGLGVILSEEGKEGVRLASLADDQSAYLGGLRDGDVVTAINGSSVSTDAQLLKFCDDWAFLPESGEYIFSITRNGTPQTVAVNKKYWEDFVETVKK
jgi:hypothetical protein